MLVVTKTVIRVISPDLEVIKRFFMLNSNEPEMSTAHEINCWKMMTFVAFKFSDVLFIVLTNVKCQQLLKFKHFVINLSC